LTICGLPDEENRHPDGGLKAIGNGIAKAAIDFWPIFTVDRTRRGKLKEGHMSASAGGFQVGEEESGAASIRAFNAKAERRIDQWPLGQVAHLG